MNSETEAMRENQATMSLEDLEKKYFKNNQNYYTNKQNSKNFDKLEFNDKDMEVLRGQMGDQSNEVPSPDPEEGLVGKIEDNPINVEELRLKPGHPYISMLKNWTESNIALIYIYLGITFVVLLWTFVLWLMYFSFSLLFCFSTRLILAINLARKERKPEQFLDSIKEMRGWILKFDIVALMWTPVKGLILSILMPHEDWSPISEYAKDHFPVIITFLILLNFFLAKRITK